MGVIKNIKIGNTSYAIITGAEALTSSSASVTIAPDSFLKDSTAITSATLTVSADTDVVHEWGAVFTTGGSQTSVTIAMSDSSTINWMTSPSNLVTSTKYAFSVTGNSTVGYIGTIMPLLY